MSEGLITSGYAVGNVLSSVAIVLVNKKVFAAGFHFPFSLSFFHFCFTIVFYRLLLACGLFSLPERPMSQFEKFKVAAAGVASIGFMNMSLSLNSVGFYQVTKLTIVPVTLAINYVYYSVSTTMKVSPRQAQRRQRHGPGCASHTAAAPPRGSSTLRRSRPRPRTDRHAPSLLYLPPPQVKLSLAILLAGVGIATVSDVELRPLGLAFGVLAVLSTAMFQIWQGSKQTEYGMSGTQLQNAVAFWQTVTALALSLCFESFCIGGHGLDETGRCDTAPLYLLNAASSPAMVSTLWYVLVTCFLALLVNWCSFGLIGKTSATTFQVNAGSSICIDRYIDQVGDHFGGGLYI